MKDIGTAWANVQHLVLFSRASAPSLWICRRHEAISVANIPCATAIAGGTGAAESLRNPSLRFARRQAYSGGSFATMARTSSLQRFLVWVAVVANTAPAALGFRTEGYYTFGTDDDVGDNSRTASDYEGRHGDDDAGVERHQGIAVALGQLSDVDDAMEEDLSGLQGSEEGPAVKLDGAERDDRSSGEGSREKAEVSSDPVVQPSTKLVESLTTMLGDRGAQMKPLTESFPQPPHDSQTPQNTLKKPKQLDLFTMNLGEKLPWKGAKGLMQSKSSVVTAATASLDRKEEPATTTEKPSAEDDAVSTPTILEGTDQTGSNMAKLGQKVEQLTAASEKARQEAADAMKFAEESAEAAETSADAGAAELHTIAPIVHTPTSEKELAMRRDLVIHAVDDAVKSAQAAPARLELSASKGKIAPETPTTTAALGEPSLSATKQVASATPEATSEAVAAQISKDLLLKSAAIQGGGGSSYHSKTKSETTRVAEASALREAALRQEIQNKAAELYALRKAFTQEVESSAARAKQAAVDAETAAGQVEMTAERARRAAHAAGAVAEEAARKAAVAEQVVTAAAREGVEGKQEDRDKKPALSEDEAEEKEHEDHDNDESLLSKDRYDGDHSPSHSGRQRDTKEKSDDDDDDEGNSHGDEEGDEGTVSSPRRRTSTPWRHSLDTKPSLSSRRRIPK
eukprot:TRINITY_DN19088_c0_g1_i1.p1 TRINITY_DN19088_c0_g1~~TRINITY_DN19088_c0_g1_i1.p1  ORF type:complete len:685 (+),score=150.97 TRINITY_DN19088_c0_g1_i1:185-2239(+)